MKIGNIVSKIDVKTTEDFNVVRSIDDTIPGIPTLIIGWEYVKKEYPDYDIINRQLSDNLYWTFTKNEKRSLHEEDLQNFVHKAYNDLIKDIEYIFIDPISLSKKNINKILRRLLNDDRLITYSYRNMLYIYHDKYIFGIDVKLLKFIDCDVNKIILKIKSKSYVFLDTPDIFIEYKKQVEILDNQIKYIPYLYSIKNG